MPQSGSRPSVLPIDWPQVLEKIQRTLAQTLTQAAEHEQAFAEILSPVPTFSDQSPKGQTREEQLGNYLRAFQADLKDAECQAAATEATLQAGAIALQNWQATAEVVWQRLASLEVTPIK